MDDEFGYERRYQDGLDSAALGRMTDPNFPDFDADFTYGDGQWDDEPTAITPNQRTIEAAMNAADRKAWRR